MTKFEEMRLRAIKFQDITGCELTIYHKDQSIRFSIFDYVENEDGTETKRDFKGEIQLLFTSGNQRPDSYIDYDILRLSESFNARFPSLLEAQGWIAVEDGLPKDKEMTQVCVDMFGSVVSGVSVGFKNHPERSFFSNVSTMDGTWCGGYGIEGDLRVTHWKPLDIFPEPFEPSNV